MLCSKPNSQLMVNNFLFGYCYIPMSGSRTICESLPDPRKNHRLAAMESAETLSEIKIYTNLYLERTPLVLWLLGN